MSKLKTHKATAKRLIPKKSKLLKRKAGQDHFNSRESAKTRMNKRRDTSFTSRLEKTARRAMPYK
ncbi:MAG: 50S ribosomal protein L35 [Candidatus Uhrbacteria bacterium]